MHNAPCQSLFLNLAFQKSNICMISQDCSNKSRLGCFRSNQQNTKYFSRIKNPGTEICKADKSRAASDVYLDSRYPEMEICDKPCTRLDIKTSLVSKTEQPGKIKFFFGKDIAVSEEVLDYHFLSLVAELGSYLGLTLGVSLLNLETVLKHICFYLAKIINTI